MPEIPQYLARQSIPARTGAPRPNLYALTTFNGNIGDTLSRELVEWAEAKQEADQRADVTRYTAEAAVRLEELGQETKKGGEWRSLPERFDTAVEDYGKSVAEGIESETVRQKFLDRYTVLAATARTGIRRDAVKLEGEENLARLAGSLKDLSRLAAQAETEEQRQVHMMTARTAIDDMAIGRWITQVKAEGLRQGFAADADEQRVRYMMNRDPAAAVAALKDQDQLTNLDPVNRERLLSSAIVQTQKLATKATAEGRAAIKSLRPVLEAGELPDPDKLTAARQAVAHDPDQSRELADLVGLGSYLNRFRELTPADMQTEINRMQSLRTKSAQDVAKISKAETLLREAKTQLENDPLSWGVKSGTVQLQPVDPGDPASVAARVNAAETVAVRYGVKSVPFTDEETDELASSWQRGDAAGRMSQAMGLAGMDMPDDMQDALWERLGRKAPLMGLVADLTGSRPEIAREVLAGVELVANDKDAAPASIDTRPAFDELMGTALAADETGKASAALKTATDALYARRARQNGWTDFKKAEYEAAVQEIAGQVIDVNDATTLLPIGMGEDEFDQRMNAVRLADLHTDESGPVRHLADGGFMPVSGSEIAEFGQLLVVGPGRYAVQFVTAAGKRKLLDRAGEPWILNIEDFDPTEAGDAGETGQDVFSEAAG